MFNILQHFSSPYSIDENKDFSALTTNDSGQSEQDWQQKTKKHKFSLVHEYFFWRIQIHMVYG